MNEQRLTVGGAVVAAIAASLCCVGPVLFAAFGLGAFGAAAIFQSARPYLLAGAVLLLAIWFYRVYLRREASCAPGEACATKLVKRVGRAGLWIASLAVLVFALTPYYVGHIASALARRQPTAAPTSSAAKPSDSNETFAAGLETVTVKIEGMSCTACEVPVRDALGHIPGVRAADVSYRRGDADIKYDPKQTDIGRIKRAIDSTGYRAK